MDDERPTTEELLQAWQDANRAAQLTNRLAVAATDAADQAERQALASEDIADAADATSEASEKAASRARQAATTARHLATERRDNGAPQAAGRASDARTAEVAAGVKGKPES